MIDALSQPPAIVQPAPSWARRGPELVDPSGRPLRVKRGLVFPSLLGTGALPFDVTSGGISTAATSLPIPLPPGIMAGNLIMLFFDCFRASTPFSIDALAGYTSLSAPNFGAYSRYRALWKSADGGETVATVTTSAAASIEYVAYVVRPWTGTPQNSSVQAGADPLNLNIGVSALRLWIAAIAFDGSQSVTGWPANYTYNRSNPTVASSNGLGVCARVLTATAEDPAAFTLSGSPSNIRTFTYGIDLTASL
jgi:hypothetical protein